MLNKNDPLIGAVQEVMRKNQADRDAVKAVNEKFGVVDRRALPHEQQANWDAAYAKVLSEGVEALDEMSEKQKKLAKVGNKAGLGGNPNEIDAPDLEGARKGHAKHIEEVLDTPDKRLKYGMKAIGSYVKASLTGDKNTKRKRLAGNKNYKKKVAQAGEKQAMDSYREKKSGEVLRDMGRKTGLGQHYDKIFKEEQLDEVGDTRKGQKLLAKVQKRATDRMVKATDSMWTSKSGMSDKDKKTASKYQNVARMADDRRVDEEHLEEKAVSKAQHRFFGLVRGIQKGEAKGSAEATKAAKSMSVKSVRDYAKTKEKGLPEKKD